jgi:hypothetical protein
MIPVGISASMNGGDIVKVEKVRSLVDVSANVGHMHRSREPSATSRDGRDFGANGG